jgi:hypothetical protein
MVCTGTPLVFSYLLQKYCMEQRPKTHNRAFFSSGATAPSGPGSPHYRSFTITLRNTTVGRIPLDEWSTRRRDLYLTTHNTHKRQTSMPPAGLEPAIPASERPPDPRLIPHGYWDWHNRALAWRYATWYTAFGKPQYHTSQQISIKCLSRFNKMVTSSKPNRDTIMPVT